MVSTVGKTSGKHEYNGGVFDTLLKYTAVVFIALTCIKIFCRLNASAEGKDSIMAKHTPAGKHSKDGAPGTDAQRLQAKRDAEAAKQAKEMKDLEAKLRRQGKIK